MIGNLSVYILNLLSLWFLLLLLTWLTWKDGKKFKSIYHRFSLLLLLSCDSLHIKSGIHKWIFRLFHRIKNAWSVFSSQVYNKVMKILVIINIKRLNFEGFVFGGHVRQYLMLSLCSGFKEKCSFTPGHAWDNMCGAGAQNSVGHM